MSDLRIEAVLSELGLAAIVLDDSQRGGFENVEQLIDAIELLVAERDRLAAENEELRKWKVDLEAKVAAASKIGMDFGEMEFDAWFPGARPKTRKELTAELAAANATLDQERAAYATLLESHEIILDALTESDAALDALREAVHPDERRSWSALDAVHAILYPQPAAMAEEKTND